MVNSSPEYAITKPGVYNTARKRDKPLKTYGKRAAPIEIDPKPLKKRVRFREYGEEVPMLASITHPKSSIQSSLNTRPTENPTRRLPVHDHSNSNDTAHSSRGNKPSILNYFRPLPPTQAKSSSARAAISPGKANMPSCPQPEPNGVTEKRRTRRMLRIRSNRSMSDSPSKYNRCEDETNGEEERSNHSGSANDIDSGATSPVPSRLRDGGDALHNQQRTTAKDKSRSDRKRCSIASQVQMTLNITNQAPFSECKLCDMLWNPLYPDDVKYHLKRHAARLRQSKKDVDIF